ncbi:carbohydrate-binding family 9-like protein [Nannochloropsis gaditana]|uniref:Carbohydrate-binding family 9-like protein n=1 Tax=Nannochloropsis gaditana TaxID=72520 RepID=W7TG33_9STRA|nr:carbohydrate-binding family 9-like protein [Nannochloropsis gaditana]
MSYLVSDIWCLASKRCLLLALLSVVSFPTCADAAAPPSRQSRELIGKDAAISKAACFGSYPRQLVVRKLQPGQLITADGQLDEEAWAETPWSAPFEDIEGDLGPPPQFETKVKMRYDDDCLWVAAYMEEPQAWATQQETNSIVYLDNDFEVFVDPNGDNHYYKEVEINAHGASWNLLLVQPYVDGGPAVCNGTLATMCASNYSSPSSSSSSSPGPSVPAWDLSSSLKAGVSVDGALNDPAVGSKGWSAEMCLPLKEYVKYEEGVNLPPRRGDYWRINFSRVQWTVKVAREGGSEVYVKDEEAPASNWVFQPMGVTNMHLPERWGYAYFSEEPAKGGRQGGREDVIEEGPRDPKWPMREALAQVYEAQKVYTTLYGGGVSYTDSVNALVLNGHLSTHVAQGFCAGIPEMEKTGGKRGRSRRFRRLSSQRGYGWGDGSRG